MNRARRKDLSRAPTLLLEARATVDAVSAEERDINIIDQLERAAEDIEAAERGSRRPLLKVGQMAPERAKNPPKMDVLSDSSETANLFNGVVTVKSRVRYHCATGPLTRNPLICKGRANKPQPTVRLAVRHRPTPVPQPFTCPLKENPCARSLTS